MCEKCVWADMDKNRCKLAIDTIEMKIQKEEYQSPKDHYKHFFKAECERQ